MYELLMEPCVIWIVIMNVTLEIYGKEILVVKAPPKCVNFMWWATLDCVQPKSRLGTHHIPIVDSCCLLCNFELEELSHVPVCCPVAKDFGIDWKWVIKSWRLVLLRSG